MSNAMAGEPYKRPYRKVMGPLIISITACAMLPYILPSLLMSEIMTDFSADMTLVGISMSIQLVIAGVMFFVGSFIVDKIGMLKTAKLAMICLLAGIVVQSIATNIAVYIIGRALSGFGYGLSVGLQGFMATWFAGKELSLIITLNSVFSALAIALSSVLVGPLTAVFGTWKGALYVFAAVTALFTVGWLVLGKDSPEGIEQETARAAQKASGNGKMESPLAMALKSSQCWKILVYASIFIVIDTARATFMPTYMAVTKGVDGGLIATAVGLNSLVGIAGSLIGGIYVAKFWRRKPVMFICVGMYTVIGLLLTFVNASAAVVVLSILLGFCYYLGVTGQFTLVIEDCMAKNPVMISGGMAMINGTSMLLTMIVSPLFAILSGPENNMTFAFRILFAAMAIAIIAIALVKETGTNPKGKATVTQSES